MAHDELQDAQPLCSPHSDRVDGEATMFRASPDAMLLAAPDGTILNANETAVRAFGLPREQLIGRCGFDFFPGAAGESRRELACEVVRTRAPAQRIHRHGERVLDVRAVPLLNAAGEVAQLAVYARDVTDWYEQEMALRRQTQRRYEADTRQALGVLASDVAHDLRNLLTPILSYLEAHTPVTDDHRTLRTAALTACERAQALVMRILRHPADPAPRPSPAPAEGEPRPRPAKTPALRVIAADDERGVLHVVEIALSMAGHGVRSFQSVAAARDAFCAQPSAFDVAILDQNLGDGTGLELARQMRELNPALRIVLASGRPDGELRDAARSLGVHLLPKPFSLESLQVAIERAVPAF